MNRRLAVLAAATAAAIGFGVVTSAAADPPARPRPAPVRVGPVTVGVYIDSITGNTSGYIDCGGDYTLEAGPQGDATLFIANRMAPLRMRCTITLLPLPAV